jgi:hypothetical protein
MSWRKRKIDLHGIRQENDAVYPGATRNVEMRRAEFELYMDSVQSAITCAKSEVAARPIAKSMSDHRSARPDAADPVTATPVMRLSARAISINNSRRLSRSTGAYI